MTDDATADTSADPPDPALSMPALSMPALPEPALPEPALSEPALSMPALLRGARNIYAVAIRSALADAGHADLPRNGAYLISAIARRSTPLGDIISHLGLTKQSAGQLVDALVERGYLDRSVDPDDRRRLRVSLTRQGRRAAKTIRTTVDDLEAQLLDEVGADDVARTRATLVAMITRLS